MSKINHFDFSRVDVKIFSIHLKCPLSKVVDGFGISNFCHCYLFVIWDLIFEI